MKALSDWYDQYRLGVDFVIVSFATVLVVGFIERQSTPEAFSHFMNGNRQTVYSAVISTAASMLGFVLATVSIIVGYVQMPRFKRLRESKHHNNLFQVYFSAVSALALLTLVGFVAIFVDQDRSPFPWMSYVVFFFSALSIARVFHCIQVLQLVTKLAGKPTED